MLFTVVIAFILNHPIDSQHQKGVRDLPAELGLFLSSGSIVCLLRVATRCVCT